MKTTSQAGKTPHRCTLILGRTVFGAILCLYAANAWSKPRIPLPPWPEQILQRWDFDAAYWAGYGGGDTSGIDFTGLVDGWSGFALHRDGLTTSPFILPGVEGGHANFTSGTGALRFWFSPSWSSTSMSGTGPGHYARLAECVVADGQSGTTAWSLYVNSNATTIYLSGQGTNGATDFLSADISWEAGRWYLLTLNYTTNGTALFINSELAAEGAALPMFNPVLSGLAIGSAWTGDYLAGGLFDEVTTFAKPLKTDDLTFYYEGTSGMAALGAISAEEEAALAEHRAEMKALREAEGEGDGMVMMRFAASGASAACVTNGPVYLTNVFCYFITNQNWTVGFDIAGGTNGVPYDIFTTTNLVGGHITNAVWEWDDVGYTCNAYTFTNQPTNQTFYVLGTTNDTDSDGLTDAFEQLVSKTLIATNDTDGDLMPDKWEWDNHLNPLLNDASDDPDGDWITNLQEYNGGTNSADPHDTMVIGWGVNLAGQINIPINLRRATAVAGGLKHTLVLQGNDTVVAWGDNTYGQTNVPPGLSNILAIAAGQYHGLALRADGSVTNWGSWYDGVYYPMTLPPALTNIVAIAAGTTHDLALHADGTVTAWGYTNETFTSVPTNLTSVKAIAAGWYHNVALRTDGTVSAWGENHSAYGWNVTNPPAGLSNVVSIAAGIWHTLALRGDGTVVAWGAGNGTNLSGNLNNSEQGQSIVPSGLSNVVAISAGGYHSFALKADGTMAAWGDRAGAPVYASSNLTVIGSGVVHGLAIRTGRLTPIIALHPSDQTELPGTNATFSALGVGLAGVHYQWQFNGTNITSQTNATFTVTNIQTSLEGSYTVVISTGAGSITSSVATLFVIGAPFVTNTVPTAPGTNYLISGLPDYFSMTPNATALGTDRYPLHYQWYSNGVIVTSATNASYLIAQSTLPWVPLWQTNPANADYFVKVWNPVGTNQSGTWIVRVISPGKEGATVAWGDNSDGQILYPTDLTNTLAIAAGDRHSVAVKEDGSVVQWGLEWDDVPADLTNAISVSAGYDHTLALRNDGTVVAWGDAGSAANTVPTDLAGVKAIAAGWNHNIALLTKGDVTAWGNSGTNLGWNLLAVPADLTNATAIAAGSLHSLALRDNGTVASWGYNDVGQTNVPAGLSNVVSIAAGGNHSLALKADGTVVAWGSATDGQCNVPSGLSNVMAIAGGWAHSVALKNDGTVVAWGNNGDGQTNAILGLSNVKMIAAGGAHTIAGVFSPLVQYPVDVTKDLLLIYNTNSADSTTVLNYYLAHRPMVSNANVLGIGCIGCVTNWSSETDYVSSAGFTNEIRNPVSGWLANNPTKRPQYVILFLDIPARVHDLGPSLPSVSYRLRTSVAGWSPFITHINMNGTNDCKAYIDKLEFIGTTYSPGKLILSASAGGYGNTNYAIDNIRHGTGYGSVGDDFSSFGSTLSVTTNGLLAAGVLPSAIQYADGLEILSNTIPYDLTHLSGVSNVAGYICWGAHSSLGRTYATNDVVHFSGQSGWFVVQTIESFNGYRENSSSLQGFFLQWFSPSAFGGTDYSNTPVGAVTHVEEPGLDHVNDASLYFGLWAGKKNFGISAWNSRITDKFQAVGDPLIIK